MNKFLSYAENLSNASAVLGDSDISNSYNEALILLSHAASLTKEQIISKLNESVVSEIHDKFMNLVARRGKHEPLAYIVGHKEFWSLNFAVSEATLIPRSDSEILVESVLKFCPQDQVYNILDMGTGSGCLLLSILHELPRALGSGIDISTSAIEVARQNASNLNLSSRANFINIAWGSFALSDFNIVISNPPYIEKEQIKYLEQEVHFEPITALDGGIDGLYCYKEIISLLPNLATPDFKGFFEIGYGQSEAVCALLEEAGFHVVGIEKDLSTIPRVIIFTNQ